MVTIREEFVKCGKKCHCKNDEKHGPYFYAYWKINGKLHKKYLGKTNPYAIKPITKSEIEELYSDLQIEKILEEKTPYEKQQEEELYQFEEYKPTITKKEKIRKKNLEKSFNKLVDNEPIYHWIDKGVSYDDMTLSYHDFKIQFPNIKTTEKYYKKMQNHLLKLSKESKDIRIVNWMREWNDENENEE